MEPEHCHRRKDSVSSLACLNKGVTVPTDFPSPKSAAWDDSPSINAITMLKSFVKRVQRTVDQYYCGTIAGVADAR